MKNAWNVTLPGVPNLLQTAELRSLLRDATARMLRAAGMGERSALTLTDEFYCTAGRLNLEETELTFHGKIMSGRDQLENVRHAMQSRAATIYSQIKRHLTGESLLDIGCGHGLVAQAAQRQIADIELCDLVDYRDNAVNLKFTKCAEGGELPFQRSFDTTLLITVLHHSQNPKQLLQQAWLHTKRRLVIIESVYGVTASTARSPLPRLDLETQLAYAVLCDWFYNRVINQNVPVPFNFTTPTNWKDIFSSLPSRLIVEEDLGVDLQIVPEHHYLFVLQRD